MRPRVSKFMLRAAAHRTSNAHGVSPPIVAYSHRAPPEGAALLASLADVRPWNDDRSPTRAELIAHARDASVLCFFVPDRIDAGLIADLPALQLLAGFGKGYDNVDVAAATTRGILVTNVPEALTDATADLAWALLLALARDVVSGDAAVRANPSIGWRSGARLGRAVTGATLGIYGFGHVGRAIAARAGGFRMRVLYHDAVSIPANVLGDARGVSRERLFAESDFVVLAVPLTASTYHAIDEGALAKMKPTAVLINPARGSIVDEAAVAVALERGTIAGYAADVFEHEDRQYAQRPRALAATLIDDRQRTVFTPHAGTAVAADRVRLALAQAEAVRAFLAGDVPASAVNAPLAKDGLAPAFGEGARRRQP